MNNSMAFWRIDSGVIIAYLIVFKMVNFCLFMQSKFLQKKYSRYILIAPHS